MRKAHRKSRSGCLNCKQRRIKCDEKKPSCNKCISHETTCTYPPPKSLKWITPPNSSSSPLNQTAASPHRRQGLEIPPPYTTSTTQTTTTITKTTTSTTTTTTNPSPSASPTPTLDLETPTLLINWFTQTSQTLNSPHNHTAQTLSRTLLPTLSLTHPFLLHGILSLSALHLSATSPHLSPTAKRTYRSLSTAHHTHGLTHFQRELREGGKKEEYSAAASIAFSSLTMIYAFGISRPVMDSHPEKWEQENDDDDDDDDQGLIDKLVQIFRLMKGWYEIIRISEDVRGISISDSSPLMTSAAAAATSSPPSNPNPISKETTLPPEIERGFATLHSLNARSSQTPPDQEEIHTFTISTLRNLFLKLESERVGCGGGGGGEAEAEEKNNPYIISEWINTLPNEFLILLERREEMALLILGYYCLVLHCVRGVWWIEGWSRGLFGEIWRRVGGQGKGVLGWVGRIVGEGGEKER